MAATMTIGDFSRATRLSAKALRFYHQVGLLEPASIDPSSGYRLYAVSQVADAQVVRELRALKVPVSTIREVVATSDISIRHRLISAHLDQLEFELASTAAAVTALRGILDGSPAPVEHRNVPNTPVVAIRETINLSTLGEWYEAAIHELTEFTTHAGLPVAGSLGGVWETDLFLTERGEAMVFAPVASLADLTTAEGRVRPEMLPAAELAVIVHSGPDALMAQTYGALATYVTEHEIGADGPIRETYLSGPSGSTSAVVTEIGWPIFRTAR